MAGSDHAHVAHVGRASEVGERCPSTMPRGGHVRRPQPPSTSLSRITVDPPEKVTVSLAVGGQGSRPHELPEPRLDALVGLLVPARIMKLAGGPRRDDVRRAAAVRDDAVDPRPGAQLLAPQPDRW